jgi:transcription elongation factor Elf1
MLAEHHFPCPHCNAPVSMLLDLSAGDQAYVEDCEVCCRPIEVRFEVDEAAGELKAFTAEALEQ